MKGSTSPYPTTATPDSAKCRRTASSNLASSTNKVLPWGDRYRKEVTTVVYGTSCARMFSVHTISSRALVNIASAPRSAAAVSNAAILSAALRPAYLISCTKTLSCGSAGRSGHVSAMGSKSVLRAIPRAPSVSAKLSASVRLNNIPSTPTVLP